MLFTKCWYSWWINRFLYFHKEKHPCDWVVVVIASFLEHLLLKRKNYRTPSVLG
ncbi:MAG: phage integrase N-terminal SAM-like domain-containing protein [Candidatus Thiodiazotropha sp. 4PDIV1]